MSGFGQEPASRRGIPTAELFETSPALLPSAAWDGNAGSGFASVPVDPPRIAAKPVCRLLVRPHQYFSRSLEIGVIAFANNDGSLVDGIAHVRFHFEGGVIDIEKPSLRTFARFDRETYGVPGYWVTLEKPDAASGDAHVYIEAVPSDPAMQSRVLGPIQFSPHEPFSQTGSVHDYEVIVDPVSPEVPGQSFQSFTAAHAWINQQSSPQNPLITLAAPDPSGLYDFEVGQFGSHSYNGWLTIRAEAPVTFGKPQFIDGASADARPKFDAVLLQGPNITLEMENMYLYTEFDRFGRGWAFDRIRIRNSGGIAKDWMLGPRSLGPARGRNWFTDCLLTDMPNPLQNAQLSRGNITSGTWYDYASNSDAVIANIGADHSSIEPQTELSACTVRYVGPAAAATLALSGSNDSTRTLVARVDGVEAGRFTVRKRTGTYPESDDYSVQAVVDFINSLPDWTAVLDSNDRRASALSLAGANGGPFSQVDAKTAPLQLVTKFDLHNDYMQVNMQGSENIVLYGCRAANFAGQKIFLSNPNDAMRDVAVINNAFHDLDGEAGGPEDDEILASQLDRNVHSHVVIAHNSLTQAILLRSEVDGSPFAPDDYCLLANNVFRAIEWTGPVDANLTISANHVFEGSLPPGGDTGTTSGGDGQSLFVDASGGDFLPSGILASEVRLPAARNLRRGVRPEVPAPAGAFS